MYRFIKMWLLLRILAYQEQIITTEQPDYDIFFQKGVILYCEQRNFIAECSRYNLFWAIFPKRFRGGIRPKKTTDPIEKTDNSRLRELSSIIEFAKKRGYIEIKKDEILGSLYTTGTLQPKITDDTLIRLSDSGDHFITLSGGLEETVKTFPFLWGIFFISLIPWLLANYTSIKKYITYIWNLI